MAGIVPMCTVHQLALFKLARFVAGVGVGIITYVLPIFISELSPPSIRGALGSTFQLIMVVGMTVAALLNTQDWFGYRASFSLPLYPAMLLCLGILFFPTSPRFALAKYSRSGAPEEGIRQARRALRLLRGSDEAAEAELRELQDALGQEEESAPWSTLWRDPSVRRRVLVANSLQLMGQFTGINALLSYGPSMLTAAHLGMDVQTAQLVISVCNLGGTVLMMLVIDRVGRRPLLLAGAGMMAGFMAGAAYIAWKIENSDDHEGMAAKLMVCLCGYITAFGIGWGGVPWIYPSEIFPMDVKEKAMSLAVGCNWLANFLIAYLVPLQVVHLKLYGTLAFYTCCLVAILVVVYFTMPETKGVPLESMDGLFGDRLPGAGKKGRCAHKANPVQAEQASQPTCNEVCSNEECHQV